VVCPSSRLPRGLLHAEYNTRNLRNNEGANINISYDSTCCRFRIQERIRHGQRTVLIDCRLASMRKVGCEKRAKWAVRHSPACKCKCRQDGLHPCRRGAPLEALLILSDVCRMPIACISVTNGSVSCKWSSSSVKVNLKALRALPCALTDFRPRSAGMVADLNMPKRCTCY